MFRIIFLASIVFVISLSAMGYVYGLTTFLRPDGLGAGNDWGSGTFDDINEIGRADADFVTSDPVKQNQKSFVIYSLTNEVDPIVDIDHVIRYTFREDPAPVNNQSPRLEVTLQQGGTDLITWTEPGPLPTTFTLATREIPTSVVGKISNYGDLRLKFEAICDAPAFCDNSNPEATVSVSWAELQYETYTTPRSHPAPQIIGIGFYKIEPSQNQMMSNIVKLSNYSKQSDISDVKNYAKYNKSGKFYEINQAISTFESKINELIQVQIKLDGVFASTRIEHLSLISTNAKSDLKSANFEIIADKGKKPNIIDPNKFIKDAKFEYSLEDGSLWVNLDLIFKKPLKKSHITLQAWDEQRLPVYAEIVNAWKISDPSNIAPAPEIKDRAVVIITQKAPSDCAITNSCYAPSEITIRKGGSIIWKNEDTVIHTIVSGTPQSGPDGQFNFAITPGNSHEKPFLFEGKYQYYCSLHPWYSGLVTVTEKSQDAQIQQYVDFKVALPSGAEIQNEKTILLKDRNTSVALSGHLPNIKKPTTVNIMIIKPDKSTEEFSIKTTRDGDYFAPIKLAKKWQAGKFEIIGKHSGKEIGHINFTITDKPIKNPKS